MTTNIILLILWEIIGLLNFTRTQISKFDYGICWIMVIVSLLEKLVTSAQ